MKGRRPNGDEAKKKNESCFVILKKIEHKPEKLQKGETTFLGV